MDQVTHKEYLGDGVYACLYRGQVVLTANCDFETGDYSSVIYLDGEVVASLEDYIKKLRGTAGTKPSAP